MWTSLQVRILVRRQRNNRKQAKRKRGNRTYSGVHSSSEIPPGQSSMFLYYDSVLFLTGPDDVTWGEPALDMQFVFLPQALPHSVRVHPSLYMQAPSSHT